MKHKQHRIIISGGGTGGHVFPAIAIADAIRDSVPDAEILFVGAQGRLEMEKVPQAGYKIEGLPVAGFPRKISFKYFSFTLKLIISMIKSLHTVGSFKPDIVVGVGGYASGPVLLAAQLKGIPTLIQEQNSYAGMTNRLLSRRAKTICVAYNGMEAYFPKNKIVLTGNPLRSQIITGTTDTTTARAHFGINDNAPVILVLGGSLGSATINKSIIMHAGEIVSAGINMILQCGKLYYEDVKKQISQEQTGRIKVFDFITQMYLAYSACDLIVSRAGACTISELCLAGKPVILVPSPNVAEDHQTKNAAALVKQNAAVMITDKEAPERLVSTAMKIIVDEEKKKELSENIKKSGIADSNVRVAHETLKLIA